METSSPVDSTPDVTGYRQTRALEIPPAAPTDELPIALHHQQIDEANDIKKRTRPESVVAANSNAP
jgi:hypothetical protein